MELQNGTKFFSNDPNITNNLPMIAFHGVRTPCEETSLVISSYASWLKLRLFVLAMSWDSFFTYGPAKCSLYHGTGNSQFLWQLEVGTCKTFTDLQQENVYVWYVHFQ